MQTYPSKSILKNLAAHRVTVKFEFLPAPDYDESQHEFLKETLLDSIEALAALTVPGFVPLDESPCDAVLHIEVTCCVIGGLTTAPKFTPNQYLCVVAGRVLTNLVGMSAHELVTVWSSSTLSTSEALTFSAKVLDAVKSTIQSYNQSLAEAKLES